MADTEITIEGGHCGCSGDHEHAHGGEHALQPRSKWLGVGGRFFGWWLGMAGLMGMFAVCPCCGTQACPNGVVGMGFVGAVMASFMRVGRWFRRKG